MGLMEGLSPQAIYEKTRDSFYRAWFIGFVVWAPVQVINLHCVPVHFRYYRYCPLLSVTPCR